MKTSSGETEIQAVLQEYAAAHAERDAERLFATATDDVVVYSLAPPLQQGPDTPYGTVDGIRAWFATFDSPVVITYRDTVTSQDGDLAFVHTLANMEVTPAGQSEPISTWFRSTFGLRRVDGSWLIAHRHDSTPFYMDGSYRAATDLKP